MGFDLQVAEIQPGMSSSPNLKKNHFGENVSNFKLDRLKRMGAFFIPSVSYSECDSASSECQAG